MRVELSEVSLKLRLPVMTSRGAITQRDGILIQISEGAVYGWGEAMPLPGWPGADLSATREALEEWATDPDLGNLPSERFAHGSVELALLDMESQQSGQTQAEMLSEGGPVPDAVELNALVADAEDAVAAVTDGYGTAKLKVGASDIEVDVAAVAAVRDSIGDSCRLRLDANGAWTVDQAVAALSRLERFDIEYVEEPVAGMRALALVAEQSPIPVAIDDSLGSGDAEIPESIPVVVVKPMALGGPRTAYAAARRWIEEGRKVIITNYFDSAIGQHAALSVAAALPGHPQVHGAITPALFDRDIADLPTIADGCCPLPPHSPAVAREGR